MGCGPTRPPSSARSTVSDPSLSTSSHGPTTDDGVGRPVRPAPSLLARLEANTGGRRIRYPNRRQIIFSRVVIALPQLRQRFRLTIPSLRRRV